MATSVPRGGSAQCVSLLIVHSLLFVSDEWCSIGPLIGGAFAVSAAGWRWSFYFNLILVALTFPPFIFLIPSSKRKRSSQSSLQLIRCLDLVGSILFSSALFTLIAALSFAGAIHPWSSPRIIGLLCSTGILWSSLAVQQAATIFTTKEDRILPIHILSSWEMWNLIFQMSCSISMLFITIFYTPLNSQFVRGQSALRSAIDLLPFLLTCVTAMLVSGWLISSVGYYKLWFIAGSGLSLISFSCLYTIEVDTPYGKIYGYLILGGIGTGLYAMNAGAVMSATVAKQDAADAATIFGCVDTICGAIAVAVANCVFVNRATDSIQVILPETPRHAVQQAIAGVGASLTNEASPEVRARILQAARDAIADVWLQLIVTAAVSFVFSFLLRNKKLKPVTTEIGPVSEAAALPL